MCSCTLLDNMTRTVGMASQTAQTLASRPPRLLVIAGATGVGKSTAAVGVAQRAGFTRVMSTDAIREIMRATDADQTNDALHRSSFSRGSSGEPVLDWNETCLALKPGCPQPLNGPAEKALTCFWRASTSCPTPAC